MARTQRSRMGPGAETWCSGGRRQTAIVMPGYRGSEQSQGLGSGSLVLSVLGRLWRVCTNENGRAHASTYRDFYANPRSQEYMVDCVGELLVKLGQESAAVAICCPESADSSSSPAWAKDVELVDFTSRSSSELSRIFQRHHIDAAIIIYPDALGIGQEPVEKAIASAFRGPLFVLNGRRRFFELDRGMRARLRRHRFFAETRVIDAILARGLAFYSTVLALTDRP